MCVYYIMNTAASQEAVGQDLCMTEMHTKAQAQQTANQP